MQRTRRQCWEIRESENQNSLCMNEELGPRRKLLSSLWKRQWYWGHPWRLRRRPGPKQMSQCRGAWQWWQQALAESQTDIGQSGTQGKDHLGKSNLGSSSARRITWGITYEVSHRVHALGWVNKLNGKILSLPNSFNVMERSLTG